ncbi:hypothetical protein [Paenibacillus sp. FSL R7-0331]|uniref:hypothetical protein n=1 Tax=Paenibacillus sp. FSL R7-0331 TaxID=1536773 RepID=UPI0004F6B48C|nr:hypothetical protein [Paenibacillus sp. FSL R7-0331]AIQ52937.1 hypothetical protein R70331_16340 [Paenibacillus sp. FSL R7-0331]
MSKLIVLLLIIIVGGSHLYLNIYKAKKQIDYRNDERWQAIQIKTNAIGSRYNDFLVLGIAVGLVVSLFVEYKINISFDEILIYSFLALSFQKVVEMIAISIYNSKM